MSNLLVAVKSSAAEMECGFHDLIRGSWAQALRGRAVVKFFIGRETDGLEGRLLINSRISYNLKSDETVLDVPDHAEGTVYKTRGICQYVIGKNISHVLIVDTAAHVLPTLFTSGYHRYDYMGKFSGPLGDCGPREIPGKGGTTEYIERCHSWALGASGFLLSRDACFEIADTFPKPSKYLVGSYDDYWVGQVLGPLVAKGELSSGEFLESVVQ